MGSPQTKKSHQPKLVAQYLDVSAARREGIVAVAPRFTNLTVLIVNAKLALALASQFTTDIHRLLLGGLQGRGSARTLSLDSPSFRTRRNMVIFIHTLSYLANFLFTAHRTLDSVPALWLSCFTYSKQPLELRLLLGRDDPENDRQRDITCWRFFCLPFGETVAIMG